MVPRDWAVWDLSSDRMQCKLNLTQSFAATGTTFTQQAQDQVWNLKMSLQAWILVSPRQKHPMMFLRTRSGHALVRPVNLFRDSFNSITSSHFVLVHVFSCSHLSIFAIWGFRDIRALPDVLDNSYSLINRWHLQLLRSSTFLMGLQGFKEIM